MSVIIVADYKKEFETKDVTVKGAKMLVRTTVKLQELCSHAVMI